VLEARRSRPEDPAGIQPPEPALPGGHRAGPEDETLLADSVGVARLVVLDTLTPAERLAFVLHDVFDVPFGKIVAAFLAASRGGDFGALLALLAPDAVLNADPAAVRMGASAQANGAEAVAGFFAGRAEAARLALVDGVPAAVWAPGGRPRAVFTFTISGAKITGIGLTADPDLLRDLDIVFLSRRGHRSRGHRSTKDNVHH
jgi:hypothetical protein